MQAFLIGGGRNSAAAHRPFVRAIDGGRVVVLLVDDPDAEPDRWPAELAEAGADQASVIMVSSARPPRPEDLEGAAGVYVAGGLTPGYRDVLVDSGTGWLDRARVEGLVYAGFSAGAAVAAERAVVGGWQAAVGGRTVPVVPEDCGEDLDTLTVADGLGVVPFLVDVHAAQWGTLNRLIHAVLDPTGPGAGWALDEATALEVVDGLPVAVHGSGAATLVRAAGDGAVLVRPALAGDVLLHS
jgi:cyanophycinase